MTKIIDEHEVRDGLRDLPPLETFNLPQAVLKVAQEIADCDSQGIETSNFNELVRLIAYWSRCSKPVSDEQVRAALDAYYVPGMYDALKETLEIAARYESGDYIERANAAMRKARGE